jgi:hypothetical protein
MIHAIQDQNAEQAKPKPLLHELCYIIQTVIE